MKNVNAKPAKPNFIQLTEIGARFNLNFSSQLVLRSKIIALDERKKSLMVLDNGNDGRHPIFIDLREVGSVTVKKTYGSIGPGELKSKDIEQFLQRIELQFELRNNREILVLPFYESEADDQKNRLVMHRNAKTWQMILSRIVESEANKFITRRLRKPLVLPAVKRLSL